uniref:Phosphatidylglycerophosphatase and protein-tyrosine phosphatase 1 n=1 Tax=Anas platyrhynchos TaxID=8839 RepID=A0A8B9SQ84_ANAPL
NKFLHTHAHSLAVTPCRGGKKLKCTNFRKELLFGKWPKPTLLEYASVTQKFPTLSIQQNLAAARTWDKKPPFQGIPTLQLVAEEKVRAVLTLNEEYETRYLCCSAQEWQALGVEQLRLSTVDLSGAPSLEQLQRGVEFLLRHREQGNSVYVHCKAGRSRSATMVAAYLIQLHHWTPQEAIEAIAKIRPHILIRRKQVQVLEAFHRNMIAGTTAEGQ